MDDAGLLGKLPLEECVEQMRLLIPSAARVVSHDFLLRPVSLDVQLTVHTKGEADGEPKLIAEVKMQRFEINFGEDQYEDIMFFTDSLARFTRQSDYIAFRPQQPKTGNPRLWWGYAIKAALTDIQRHRREWSWEYFAERRDKRKAYITAYFQLLSAKKKPSSTLVDEVHRLEGEIEFDDLVRYRESATALLPKKEEKSKGGWFSGWFGGGGKSKRKKVAHDDDLALTDEQKRQIYGAIGYDEAGVAATEVNSEGYVSLRAGLSLTLVHVSLTEGTRRNQAHPNTELTAVKAHGFRLDLSQRPGAEAVSVDVQLDSIMVLDGTAPEPGARDEFNLMVQPRRTTHRQLGAGSHDTASEEAPFFRVHFETNPLDRSADSVVNMTVQPVEMVYRPTTVARLSAFFAPPAGLALEDVTNAASKRAYAMAEQTTTGLKYAVEQHKTLNLHLNVGAPTIIVPAERAGIVMVLDLGRLSVVSELQPKDSPSLEQFEESMYDRFRISLENVQSIIVGKASNVDWREALEAADTSEGRRHFLLEPMSVELRVMQCVQQDNFAFSKLKVQASIPRVHLRLSDCKYRFLLALAEEISATSVDVTSKPSDPSQPPQPLNPTVKARRKRKKRTRPKRNDEGATHLSPNTGRERSLSVRSALSDEFFSADEGDGELASGGRVSPDEETRNGHEPTPHQLEQRQEVVAEFHLGEIGVTLSQQQALRERDLIQLRIEGLEIPSFVKRTFDTKFSVSLAAVNVLDLMGPQVVHLVESNPQSPLPGIGANALRAHGGSRLIEVDLTLYDEESPTLQVEKVRQVISASFGSIRVHLCRESVQVLSGFLNRMLAPSASSGPAPTHQATSVSTTRDASTLANLAPEDEQTDDGFANLRFEADFGSLQVSIATRERPLVTFILAGFHTLALLEPAKSSVTADLQLIELADVSSGPDFVQTILSVSGEEVFSLRADFWNVKRQNPLDPDMDVEVHINGLQVVYLARLVAILTAYGTDLVPAQSRSSGGRASPSPSVTSMTSVASIATAAVAASIPAPKLGAKLKLQVLIKAPLITVPISSDSPRLLVLDLGTLSVHNELKTEVPGELGEESSIDLVTDHMDIVLEEMELYLVDVSAVDGTQRRMLIEPITVTTMVKRCLNQEYRGLPALDLSCEISPIVANLGDGDYADLLAITTGNLAEAKQVPQFEAVSDEEHGLVDEAGAALAGPEDALPVFSVDDLEAEAMADPPGFTVTITEDPTDADMMAVAGNQDSSVRPRSVSRAVRQAMVQAKETTVYWLTTRARVLLVSLDVHLTVGDGESLASLTMKGLGADVAIHSDDTKNVKAWLFALEVADTRTPALSKFPMMLEQGPGDPGQPTQRLLKVNSPDAPVNLVEARIDQQGHEQSIVVLLGRPKLDVCMDFVQALLAFLPAQGEDPLPDTEASVDQVPPVDTAEVESLRSTNAAAREGRMKLHFILDDLQVTLLEDHTDSNCRAIRLYTDAR